MQRGKDWLRKVAWKADEAEERQVWAYEQHRAKRLHRLQNGQGTDNMPKYMRKEWFLKRLVRARAKAVAANNEAQASGVNADWCLGYKQALDDVEAMLLRSGEPADPRGYWKMLP